MIVRVSEALVRPEALPRFLDLLHELVASFPDDYDGMLSHEVLVDVQHPNRVVYLSRWRDEADLVGYAGAAWLTSPVTFPDEDTLLLEPLTLRHFTSSDQLPDR